MPLRASVSIALVFASTLSLARPTAGQGPAPTLTVRDQAASFSAPLAMLDETRSAVSLLFASSSPSAAAEAAARAAGAWTGVLAQAGPSVVVDLAFTPGSTSGLVGQLTACAVTAHGFRAPLALAGGAARCHIVSVGGMLKSPGGMAGLLEGKGDGYALRLPFSVAFGPPVPTAAAPAASSRTTTASAPPAFSPVTASAPSMALGTVAGTGTYQGQTVTVTHGLAWWAAEQNQLRVALFDHAPGPGLLAAARKGEFDGGQAPLVTVYVGFSGAGRDLAAADYCYVDVTFPKGGPMGLNSNPKNCGLETLTTDGRPGGSVLAVVKGNGPARTGRFSWDVRFHLPIAR